ncbi:hypothetical protein H6G76_12390 [Nostoc sp. FACHB-152]|uniref:hypothetical protein n=1 Tax=unclassified Nostoc TaxID=2593658 RepID=UPI0016856EBB|nr:MULTISPECIES: hypothetical protein [unclassified Nostoc]MBD2447963.1 hypothetical protein [Nostoc sp. FACHB-152]MBD2466070.1 hypothetical protein [Nostoc sp. FACHB-145]
MKEPLLQGYGLHTSQKKLFEYGRCVMDDSSNAPQIWGGALRWRDNTPYKIF